MGAALKIVDQEPNGKVLAETLLELASQRVTAREIIDRRVRAEVAGFNATDRSMFNGLVQPVDTERVLNGYRLKKPRSVNADEQCRLAHRAFESNGFFMLADERQVESLDEVIVVRPDSKVVFVKLVPLVGG